MAQKNIPTTLEDIRAKQWLYIKSLREVAIYDNIEYNGNIYQANKSSRESMDDAIEELALPTDTIDWRLADNSTVTITKTDLQTIRTEWRKRKQILFTASWLCETHLENITDINTLKTEDLDQLFSDKISESETIHS